MRKQTNDPILRNILKNSRSYEEGLYEDLQDPEEAQTYLEAAIEAYEADGESESLLLAMRDVAEAQGVIGNLEEPLDKHNLLDILFGLGFRVRLERKEVPVPLPDVPAESQKVQA